MSVQRIEFGRGDRRQAPIENGPAVEVLLGEEAGEPLGAAYVVVPPGGGMPAHNHGASETLLTPLAGRVRVTDADQGGGSVDLEPGALGVIPVGDRVELRNDGDEEARLLVVFSPADFATRLRSWPVAETAASG